MIINDLYTILAHRKMQKIENTQEKHPITAKTQRTGTHEQASIQIPPKQQNIFNVSSI